MFKSLRKKLSCCVTKIPPKNYDYHIRSAPKTLRNKTIKLDLNEFDTYENDEYLNKILAELELNNSIAYIHENDRFNFFKVNFDPRINQIINQLIRNNQTYDLFPDTYTYCLMANHCYCLNNINNYNIVKQVFKSKPILSDNYDIREEDEEHANYVWQILSSHNWTIKEIFRADGYKSIIYVNEYTKQIVFAIQGFKIHISNYFTNKHESYIDLITKIVHQNVYCLINHLKASIELSQKSNYSLSFTSYSFGAILSDLCVYLCHKYFNLTQVKSVKFDSVGSFQLLNQLNSDTPNQIDLNQLDFESYLTEFNFINTCEQQTYGKMFSLSLKNLQLNSNLKQVISLDKKTDDPFVTSGFKCLDSFNLKLILYVLSKKTCVCKKILKWPTHSTIQNTNSANFKPYTFYDLILTQIDSNIYDEITSHLSKVIKLVFRTCRRISLGIAIRTIEYSLEYELVYNDKRILDLDSNQLDKLLFVLSLTDLNDQNDLLSLHLNSLKKLYLIKYNLEDAKFYLIKVNDILVDKISRIMQRLLEIYPNLLRLIDTNDKKISIMKYVYQQRVNILKSIDLKNHIDLKIELNKQITIFTSQSGYGKHEFCLSYARQRLEKEPNLIVKFIDCSTNYHILIDLYKFAHDLEINLSSNLNIFSQIKDKLNSLANTFKFLIVFLNIKDFEFIRGFYQNLNQNIQMILTSNLDYSSRLYQIKSTSFYLFTNRDYLDLFEKYKLKLNRLISDNHLTIQTLIDKLKDKKIIKIKTALNCLASNQIDQLDDFIKIHDNLLNFIKEENLETFHFLQFCSLVDCNHLETNLLRSIYSLINNNDSDDKQFNNQLNYLTRMNVLNRNINGFKLHDYFKQILLNQLNDQVKIANILLPKLLSLNIKSDILYKHVFTVLINLTSCSKLNSIQFKFDSLIDQIKKSNIKLFNLIDQNLPLVRLKISLLKAKPKRAAYLNIQSERDEFIESTRYLFDSNYIETDHLLQLIDRNRIVKAYKGHGKTTLCVKYALNLLRNEPNLVVKFLDKSSKETFEFDAYKLARQFDIKYLNHVDLFDKLNQEIKDKNLKIFLIIDNLKDFNKTTEDLMKCLDTDYLSSVFILETNDKFDGLNEFYLNILCDNYSQLNRVIDQPDLESFRNYFNELLAKSNGCSFSVVNSIIKLFLNNPNWRLDDLDLILFNRVSLIKERHFESFNLLSYLSHVNGDYLNLNFLNNLFQSIKHGDSIDLKESIDYLIQMNVLNQISETRFKFSKLIQKDLNEYFDFMPKSKCKLVLFGVLENMLTTLDESKQSVFDDDVEICFKQFIFIDEIESIQNDQYNVKKLELIGLINNIDSCLGRILSIREQNRKVDHLSLFKRIKDKEELDEPYLVRLNKFIEEINESIKKLIKAKDTLDDFLIEIKILLRKQRDDLYEQTEKNVEEFCEKLDKKFEISNEFVALSKELDKYLGDECIEHIFRSENKRKQLLIDLKQFKNKVKHLKNILEKSEPDDIIWEEIDEIIKRMYGEYNFSLCREIVDLLYVRGKPKLVGTNYEQYFLGKIEYDL